MIDPQDQTFSLRQQCGLLGINRSNLYYQAVGESQENLGLIRLLDEQYTRTPYYGVLRMTAYLRRDGHDVNPKRVRRLLRIMGLEAIYQKPNTSHPNPEHKVYPYLLRGLAIERCNQVWSTDITYVRLSRGFVYLMAIIELRQAQLVQPLCIGLGSQHDIGCRFLYRSRRKPIEEKTM